MNTTRQQVQQSFSKSTTQLPKETVANTHKLPKAYSWPQQIHKLQQLQEARERLASV